MLDEIKDRVRTAEVIAGDWEQWKKIYYDNHPDSPSSSTT
jgi:hypothetical protein